MRIYYHTDRLILRTLKPEDAPAAFLWCGDPDVARYMVYPVYTREEDVRSWIGSLDPDDPDECEAGFVLKSTGELIGSGGMYFRRDNGLWTIGYNLRKDQWGRGYACEAIGGVLEYVRSRREVRGIQGTFADDNPRSRRVMEKLGMAPVGDITLTKLDGSAAWPGKRYWRIFE